MGSTRIGQGSKFADLISIGHGATIGAHCLFVSLVGVAGSADVGNYVVLGGQVGVSGHLKIGDGVQAMAKSGIASDVEAGQKVGGVPAVSADLAKRNALVATDLAGMLKRVRELEQRLAELEQGVRASP
jgi:UDP-3-O-[3-hydroxymyristoyl] glucosamine N-acyltransferase